MNFCAAGAFALCLGALMSHCADAQVNPRNVTAADVLAMESVGLSDAIIIAKIRRENTPVDLSTEDMVKLKRAKVSDNVISALIDPKVAPSGVTSITVQSSLAPTTGPSGATTGVAGDPNDPMSPHDSGIYIFTKDHDGRPKMIMLERAAYQGAKTGGMFASGMTYGIVKAKSKAIIPGKTADIRVGDPRPVFYFYFEDKAAGLDRNGISSGHNISSPNQFALVRLKVEKRTRTAEIGEFSIWGASSGNNQKDIIALKTERLKPGLYRVVFADIVTPGEYCFMEAPSSTSSYAGAAGVTSASDVFDFGVDN